MQGGHVETGETPEAAARRELFEESGAVSFSLEPFCDYWAGDEKGGSNGAAFLARIIAPKIFACAGIACSAALCDPWLVQSRKGGAVDAH